MDVSRLAIFIFFLFSCSDTSFNKRIQTNENSTEFLELANKAKPTKDKSGRIYKAIGEDGRGAIEESFIFEDETTKRISRLKFHNLDDSHFLRSGQCLMYQRMRDGLLK